jgi:hypothetical protein
MSDSTPFTDLQWWKISDCNMSLPLPLSKADLAKPFLYDRKWGVFQIQSGYHQAGMALLLAFHTGHRDGIDAARAVGGRGLSDAADFYLENIPGVCFRSSVGQAIYAGRQGSLRPMELRILGEVRYLFNERPGSDRARML